MLPSPAKVNLFLNIIGRRNDGYHLLESVFAKLNLCDEIAIEPHHQMLCESDVVGDNIAIRVADELKKLFSITQCVKIKIKKNIPIGSGLGGGSSNAATVIKALIKFWNIDISEQELLKLAIKIGADVPFFLQESAALVSGIGEIVKPIHLNKQLNLVLVNSGCKVATSEVFKMVDKFSDPIQEDLATLIYDSKNDLEQYTLELYPELLNLKYALETQIGVQAVRMSGSGSTFFGIFENETIALNSMHDIKNKNPTWMVWHEKITI